MHQRRNSKRRCMCDVPSSFFTPFQMRTVTIHHTIPTPSHTSPISPMNLWNLHTSLPLLQFHSLFLVRHRPSYKLTNPTSERLEIFLANIIRHPPRQRPPNRNHTRRMRTNQHRLFPLPTPLILNPNNPCQRIRTSIVQLLQPFSLRTGHYTRLPPSLISRKQPPQHLRRRGTRMRKPSLPVPFPQSSVAPHRQPGSLDKRLQCLQAAVERGAVDTGDGGGAEGEKRGG